MRPAFVVLTSVFLCACSSAGGAAPDSSGAGGSAGGVNSQAGSGGFGGSSPDDMSITLAPYTLQPGGEQINCQYFPPDGKDRWIRAFDVDASEGSHHVIPFRVKDQGTGPYGPIPCMQVDIPNGFDGMLPGTQQQHTEFALPDGVGFRLNGDEGLYFQSHFINITTEPLTANVTWRAYTMPAESVVEPAGMMFYSNFALNIPIGESTSSDACAAPADMYLFTTSGHMHEHGLEFEAKVNDTVVFDTMQWNEPNGRFFPAPGFAVHTGDTISWECTYGNDTGGTLHFGNSATKNEMCIFAALFYPSPDSASLDVCMPPTPAP